MDDGESLAKWLRLQYTWVGSSNLEHLFGEGLGVETQGKDSKGIESTGKRIEGIRIKGMDNTSTKILRTK